MSMQQNYSAEILLEENQKIEIRVKLNGDVNAYNAFKEAITTKLERAIILIWKKVVT